MYLKQEIEKVIEDFHLNTLTYNKKANQVLFSIITQIDGDIYLKQDFNILLFNQKKVPLAQVVLSEFKLHQKEIFENIDKARMKVKK